MAGVTPRRSMRIPHTHTPKLSERKKGLFQGSAEATAVSPQNLTKHRKLPVVDSESDTDDCDLGIISTLDSSSCDENDQGLPKTPDRSFWRETRLQSKRLLKENNDLKNFIRSPYTLKKYQTRYSCSETKCTGSSSTPVTPHLQNNPGTPSSTHSCNSAHTTSSSSSKARKSLASLIADTESCSSSLKDLNFDTDSSMDSKENTPTKLRRSSRKSKMTPKFQSFKGILVEQRKNVTQNTSPHKNTIACLTKMELTNILSPTQMLKTPHNGIETSMTPPKLGPNRRPAVEIQESPESTCESDKSYKRLRNNSISDEPNPKYLKLDQAAVSKARVSLFNSDRLKEILSTKSFYGKTNPELNKNVVTKISYAIEAANSQKKRVSHRSDRRRRKPGQINMGVKHRIRKPKINKNRIMYLKTSNLQSKGQATQSFKSTSDASMNNTTLQTLNSSQELDVDKPDPFDKEKQTIEALLSQWNEEDVPESELTSTKPRSKPEVSCFNSSIIEETSTIFEPVTAVPVSLSQTLENPDAVIIELGYNKDLPMQDDTSIQQNEISQTNAKAQNLPNMTSNLKNDGTIINNSIPMEDLVTNVANKPRDDHNDVVMSEDHLTLHGEAPKGGQFLPVEGGFILVDDSEIPEQEELTDLDAIENELRMLDEQILKMAENNNINANAVLASTEDLANNENDVPVAPTSPKQDANDPKAAKVFSIFKNPNPGTATPTSKASKSAEKKKSILKSGSDQYVIDAGQKKFGATQCNECGVIYQIGDPQDERDHLIYHNATNVLRFNGWKEECVVGTWSSGRCIRVRGGTAGWRRVVALLQRVVHPQLGYASPLPDQYDHHYTAYLYVENKQIIGCCVVEPKAKAYKFLPGEPDCCSIEEFSVKCGISRIWVHNAHRRRGVARRMLECARASYLYGEALRTHELAFSSPTPQGKLFATNYTADGLYAPTAIHSATNVTSFSLLALSAMSVTLVLRWTPHYASGNRK